MFLDRDGTITEEVGYLNHLNRYRLLDRGADAIRRLNEAKLAVIVVTNQSGVGRGYFPEQVVHDVHEKMIAELLEFGARIDGVYYCPHIAADQCDCRKPRTGMLEQAAREHHLDVKRSFVLATVLAISNWRIAAAREVFWCGRATAKASWPGTRKVGLGSRTSLPRTWPTRPNGL